MLTNKTLGANGDHLGVQRSSLNSCEEHLIDQTLKFPSAFLWNEKLLMEIICKWFETANGLNPGVIS